MAASITINGRVIGEGHPCFIIAEACDNHLGDMEKAKKMIVASKNAGADAVKFQHHLPDVEMLPDLPMSDNFEKELPLYEFLKKYALTLEQHAILKAYADSIGITYLCTPFSYKAAAEIDKIGVPAFKIGSGEMTDVPSLRLIADFCKPMIVSTGMSSLLEVDRTYEALIAKNVPLALLHCVSEYPPVYEDIHLDAISVMRERYPKAVIGHSDHTPDLFTCFAAVTIGAHIIEKHVILDKNQKGPDQAVSIDFNELATLVDGIRKIEKSRGTTHEVLDRERPIRTWAFRFAVTEKALPEGAIITKEMIHPDYIWTKRTGRPDGIPSHEIEKLIGMTVRASIAPNSPLYWEDVR